MFTTKNIFKYIFLQYYKIRACRAEINFEICNTILIFDETFLNKK